MIGAGPLQLPAYISAKKKKLEVIGIDRNRDAPGLELANRAYVIDTNDWENALEVARKENIDGVMTLCTDGPVVTAAIISEDMGLIGNSVSVAKNVTDKYLMREVLQKSNIECPRYTLIRSESEIDKVDELTYPLVMKPVDASGSLGVVIIRSKEDIVKKYRYSRSQSKKRLVLIEEYVTGSEVSVESITVNGLHNIIAITQKRVTSGNHRVELGHTVPCRLSSKEEKSIKEVTQKVLNAFEIKNSATHLELKYERDKIHVIELGARLGGDYITTDLVPLATGIDMVGALIHLSIGEEPDLKIVSNRSASIRYITRINKNSIDAKKLKYLRNRKRVMKIVIENSIGKGNLSDSSNRMGYVIVVGTVPKEVEEYAKNIANYLEDD